MRRLESGGRIDRSRPLDVRFDGQSLPAFLGDTLASAMLAGGVSLVGRSFKYHRPRGVFSAGVEEPNAMVHLREGDRHEPNVRATVTEAFDGLVSTSQNAWPSLKYDVGAVNNLLGPLLSAGFYYKTFIGPFKHSTRFWMLCETFIRRAAGMGRGTYLNDPDSYEKRHAFCDVLIIGGGAAGLSAALAAGRAGARVMLVEQDRDLGGAMLCDAVNAPGDGWLAEVKAELEALNTVKILTRTTAVGAYDGDTYALVERVGDHFKVPEANHARQRYWQVHAPQAVLATGALERPLVFRGNDKPGVMLAEAARCYLNRYAVLVGDSIVVATNNDSAYQAAAELARAGATVTLVDMRADVTTDTKNLACKAGVQVYTGHGVLRATGATRVAAAVICPVDEHGYATGEAHAIAADVIAVSGGWAPVVHLWSQRFGKPVYDPRSAGFIAPEDPECPLQCAGTSAAADSLKKVIAKGFDKGAEAARATGHSADPGTAPDMFTTGPFWQGNHSGQVITSSKSGKVKGKAFVDLQHDVKLSDIDQAHREGYASVEHLKRYTTLGMATDQGKLSNVNALARMADLRQATVAEVGTTTFRPPFTPVTIGAFVGHEHGLHFRPTRRSPIHALHLADGAKMTKAGAWERPWYYPQSGEDLRAAYIREAAHVRQNVGMIDVSTLGKIAVQGPDAAEFLNRFYVNGWKTLAIGRLRYGVMLREDGFVMDDGATARLGQNDYFMTTTTANAAKVLSFMERMLQTAWRDLRVHVTSVTDQWAAIAVAGPKSRALLNDVSDVDVSLEALPNNHFTHAEIGGVEGRLHRMSYSGELAFEIYVPAGFGCHVWKMLEQAGTSYNLRPYGTEAMGALRIEKGHVAGPEIEGRTTLRDIGLESFASSKKPFVGSVLHKRPVLEDSERPVLVGLEIDGDPGAKAGALLFAQSQTPKGHGDGWVSSTTYSPALGKNIALAFLRNGANRKGEHVKVVDFVGDQTVNATVVSHHFYDPKGERQNG